MKRYIPEKSNFTRYTVKFDIDIFCEADITASNFVFDSNSPEYASFVESMVAVFTLAGYELSNNPEWTHKSNKGSETWYYTFLKIQDSVEIKIIVNVRISDHIPFDKPWASQSELRSRYVSKLSKEVANKYDLSELPYPAAINVIIDGKALKSYYAAVAYIRKHLIEIEQSIEDAEDN